MAEPVREAALLPAAAGEPPAALLLEDAGAPPLGFGGGARLLEPATGEVKVEPWPLSCLDGMVKVEFWRLSCRDGAFCAPATRRIESGAPARRCPSHVNTQMNTASDSPAR